MLSKSNLKFIKFLKPLHTLNSIKSINSFKFNFPLKNFSEKKKNFSKRMDMILEKHNRQENANKEENKFIEQKTLPLLRKTQLMRLPIYLTLPFLIWTSPVSSTYSILLHFSNYYLVFLTCLEGSALFSLAHNSYNMVVNSILPPEKEAEFVIQRKTVIRKRLFMMIFFFFSLIACSIFALNEDYYYSLASLFFTNVYLYGKFSYHITLFYAEKTSFTRRIKHCGMNILLIMLVAVIASRKRKFINNNLAYTSNK